MTTYDDRPPFGPFAPHGVKGPSSFGDTAIGNWVVYAEGERICCPGRMADRRKEPYRQKMGDRRAAPRENPCAFWWGRAVVPTMVRVKRQGQPPVLGTVAMLDCPDCNMPVEFATVAAREAA